MKAKRARRAAIFLVLLGALFALYPLLKRTIESERMRKETSQVDQIVKACKLYAMDWDGIYPCTDTSKSDAGEFTNSTDAFNELIRVVKFGPEDLFYVPTKNPAKSKPNLDGVLTAAENNFSYVVGQSDSTPARSPLVADEMISPGVVGEYHPWLHRKRIIVGYCGGQVKIERLDSNQPGAEVIGAPGSANDYVYSKASEDEDIFSGLFIEPDMLVHPE